MFLPQIKLNSINFNSFKGKRAYECNTVNLMEYLDDEFVKSSKIAPLKRGQIIDDDGTIFNIHATKFFRCDVNWNKFSKYIKTRFKDYDKINTYVYACSDGSEPYSLSIMMQHKFKDNAQKFFPIYAKDIDGNLIAENIKIQHTGKINKDVNIPAISYAIGMNKKEMKRDFVTKKFHLFSHEPYVAISKKVTEPVIFSEANILDDLENIDNKNPSIIMCKNMWPYVDSKEYQEFANNLYSRLAKDSIVVLGGLDCYTDKYQNNDSEKISKALLNAGFEPSNTLISTNDKDKLIYEKN